MSTDEPKPRDLFHVFSTMDVGGAQVRFAKLANKFDIPFRNLLFATDQRYESVNLLLPHVDREVQEIDFGKGQTLRNLLLFRRTLNKLNPDVLVTYNWGAIEWAMANFGRNCPHVHVVDGFGPEEADGQLARRVWFRRLALWPHTTTVVPSQTLYDIVTRIWRLPAKNVAYIPNGIDCTRFGLPRDPALAQQYGLDDDNLVIGTVAALRPEKNLIRLIDAFSKTVASGRKAKLLIVGDGQERPGLEDHAKRLGLADRVVFTGYIADPSALLALCDIFALSSDTEQMPIGVLEAMATRLPVAAVDVGDVRNMVSDENRPFIVARDTDALANVLSTFLDDDTLRQDIGRANHTRVEATYSESEMVAAWARIFSAG